MVALVMARCTTWCVEVHTTDGYDRQQYPPSIIGEMTDKKQKQGTSCRV